jgi:hypothetical protein
MHPAAERAKQQLPSVLLTLTSIIQALSLEVLWSSASAAPHLWAPGPAQVTGWLQVAAVFQIVVLIWLYYAQLIMRFRWVPTVGDSIVPFVFGLGQFVLAELIQPEFLHLWLYVLAAVFVIAFLSSTWTFRAARQDPDNDWYFAQFSPSPVAQYGPPAATLALILLLAAIAGWVDNSGPWAVVAMIGANLVLLVQIGLQHYYWKRTVLKGVK